ncbi:cytochrome c oxidase subunit 6C-like [Pomacea canaliculata]|uniref:cytochrome c oxidase subunit 6C-like n=1 Tax=Pomacea canaliculata TaxID=400727 RepID=UPI000D73AA79|nr:cytochrome c oxidase subunit 6C-like [Pomacea canaliculata]
MSDYPKHENSGLPILGPQFSRMMGMSSGAKTREKIKGIQLRGFCAQRLRKQATVAAALAVFVVVAKVTYNNSKKRKYLKFYETYDAAADFERMKKADVFQCLKQD